MLKKLFSQVFQGLCLRTLKAKRQAAQNQALRVTADKLLNSDDFHSALIPLQALAASTPNDPRCMLDLGYVLLKIGSFAEARIYTSRAITLNHMDAAAQHQLGIIEFQQGNEVAAITAFHIAIKHDPQYAPAHAQLGIIAAQKRLYGKALYHLEKATELDSSNSGYWNNLGIVLKAVNRHQESILALEKSLAIAPDDAGALNNMAATLRELGRTSEAESLIRRSIGLNSSIFQTWCNLGTVMIDTGRIEEAKAAFRHATLISNEAYDAEVQIGCIEIAVGQYNSGWEKYEKRKLTLESPERGLPFKEWHDEDINNKTILVYAEQGLGDQIMFSSCIPELLRAGANCILECDEQLTSLFQRSFPRVNVQGHPTSARANITWAKQLQNVDYQIPIGSLPLHFRKTAASFPAHDGYLLADTSKIQYWREMLQGLTCHTRVGISWRGGLMCTRQLFRSFPLKTYLPLFEMPGFAFVCLQYGDITSEIADLQENKPMALYHWPEALVSLDDTAALIEALDLVITVCNTTVHLGCALGKETWVLAPATPEWRYQYTGSSLPWYPSAKLFRQQRENGWESVIQEVKFALGGHITRL